MRLAPAVVIIAGAILFHATPGAAQVRPTAIRISEGVSKTLIVKKVEPEYPEDARKERIQGDVIVQVRISKEGDVTDAKLISGHPELVQAAIDAVKQWKYKPFLLNGQPLIVDTQATVKFHLKH